MFYQPGIHILKIRIWQTQCVLAEFFLVLGEIFLFNRSNLVSLERLFYDSDAVKVFEGCVLKYRRSFLYTIYCCILFKFRKIGYSSSLPSSLSCSCLDIDWNTLHFLLLKVLQLYFFGPAHRPTHILVGLNVHVSFITFD